MALYICGADTSAASRTLELLGITNLDGVESQSMHVCTDKKVVPQDHVAHFADELRALVDVKLSYA